MGRKLFVGNLPFDTGESDLQDLFAQAGTVDTVKVMRDMATGRARGFAFVEMSTDAEAKRAIDQLNNFQLGGGFGGGGGDSRRRRSEPRW